MVRVVSLLTTDVSTRRLSAALNLPVFGVCNGLVSRDSPLAVTVLYPRQFYATRYLNSFRGEPAISGLV